MENYIAPLLAPRLCTARSWMDALKSFAPEPEIKKRTMVASSISSESPGCVVRLAFSVVRHCLCNHAGSDYKDWLSEWKLVLTVPGCAGVYFIPLCVPCVYSCVLWWKTQWGHGHGSLSLKALITCVSSIKGISHTHTTHVQVLSAHKEMYRRILHNIRPSCTIGSH